MSSVAGHPEGTLMNISDLRTRADALNERSCLVTRSAELEETLALTLVDSAEGNDVESCEMPDPLIQALVDKLPKPHTVWPIDDRANWLKAAAMAFNLIYRTKEREERQSASALKAVG
jgi:hypothetical protein